MLNRIGGIFLTALLFLFLSVPALAEMVQVKIENLHCYSTEVAIGKVDVEEVVYYAVLKSGESALLVLETDVPYLFVRVCMETGTPAVDPIMLEPERKGITTFTIKPAPWCGQKEV